MKDVFYGFITIVIILAFWQTNKNPKKLDIKELYHEQIEKRDVL